MEIKRLVFVFAAALVALVSSAGIQNVASEPTAVEPTPSYAIPFGEGADAWTIPLVDLAAERDRWIITDKEKDQYLGHPTTALMGDGKTIFCVYPNGHGQGTMYLKRSDDCGATWSDRLPTPKNWDSCKCAPCIYRLLDAQGKARVFVFTGTRDFGPFTPVRSSYSEDEGKTWTELAPIGTWGGVMAITDIIPVDNKPGRYMGMFFDAGGFLSGKDCWDEIRKKYPNGVKHYFVTLVKTFTDDGGLTWSFPEPVFASGDAQLIDPGLVRSPDGKRIACLLRENTRRYNSQIIFSDDEGKTWTEPRPLPAALCGDRHVVRYLKDGRLFVTFRDYPRDGVDSPTKFDWVAWVGTWEDLVEGKEGQYRVRLAQNHKEFDCAYPGSIVSEDGTVVVTTYGHWDEGEEAFLITLRLNMDELDKRASEVAAEK